MKKLFVFLLSVTLLFEQTVVSAMVNPNAVQTNNEEIVEDAKLGDIYVDLKDSMNFISVTINSLPDIDPQVVSSFSSKFANFMQYAGYAGTAIGLVNGSVAFLQLIGVMQDSKMAKLINISDQIQTINDKLNEMDNKLNDITSQMSKIEASIDFHARDQKSDYLLGIWRDFNTNYLEKGLDKDISDYQAKIINGLKDWYENRTDEARLTKKVDNNTIVMLYVKDGDDYRLIYNPYNEIPKDFPEDGRYIILKGDAVPKNLDWNVNTYTQDLESAISTNIRNNLTQRNFSVFETKNYSFLTPEGAPKYIDQGPTLEIQKLAKDAASTLIYHITSAEVNKDATFTKNLIQDYKNYVEHFTADEDGIDCILKSMYLTHAFEKQTKDDINNFLDRSVVKAGTYGLFVTNVLGMSDSATDDEKTDALERLVKSVKKVQDAKKNAITGYDEYSYVTNTRLALIDGSFKSSSNLYVRFGPGERRAYHSFDTEGIKFEHGYSFPEGSNFIGDVNMQILMLTLNSNGYPTSPQTIIDFFGQSKYNYSEIMTSYSAPIEMPMDDSISMHWQNVSGNYFPTKTATNKLPSDATNSNVKYAQKVTGSIFNTNSGKLESNKVLSALAIYAEGHDSWFTDETAFMGGPSNWGSFSDYVENIPNGDDTKVLYTTTVGYTAMYAVPIQKEETELLGSEKDDSYNPLISYRDMSLDVPKKEAKKANDFNYLLYVGAPVGGVALIALIILIIKGRKKQKVK